MKITEITSVSNNKAPRAKGAPNAVKTSAFGSYYLKESDSFWQKKEEARKFARIVCALSVLVTVFYFWTKKMGKSNFPT